MVLPLLTSALDECEQSASGLCHFTPGERAPGTHYIRGCHMKNIQFKNSDVKRIKISLLQAVEAHRVARG
jgi:hypothetical protein